MCGSHERHRLLHRATAGNFPLWLALDQVRVITLNDDEALINYAKPIVAELREHGARGHGFQRDAFQGEDFQRGT
jgi:threonyl-tRNA synthetase